MPYSSIIPNDILIGIMRQNKKKIFCSYHLDEKLILLHGQKCCIICNKISRKKSSKKYLQKKELAKSAKFTTRF